MRESHFEFRLTAALVTSLIYLASLPAFSQEGEQIIFADGRGIEITLDDISHYFSEYGPGLSSDRARIDTNIDVALNAMYNAEALAAKVEITETEKREIADYLGRQEVVRFLAKQELERRIAQHLQSINWDAMAEEYYLANQDEFQRGEQVRASHILFTMGDKRLVDVVQAAERVRELALEGEDFSKLADTHSSIPPSAPGGDLGFFERGRMVAPFDEAAFSMEIGEVSDLVVTRFGVHIIKVTDRKPSELQPLESVRGSIRQILEPKVRADFREALLADIRAQMQSDLAFRNEKLIAELISGESTL